MIIGNAPQCIVSCIELGLVSCWTEFTQLIYSVLSDKSNTLHYSNTHSLVHSKRPTRPVSLTSIIAITGTQPHCWYSSCRLMKGRRLSTAVTIYSKELTVVVMITSLGEIWPHTQCSWTMLSHNQKNSDYLIGEMRPSFACRIDWGIGSHR